MFSDVEVVNVTDDKTKSIEIVTLGDSLPLESPKKSDQQEKLDETEKLDEKVETKDEPKVAINISQCFVMTT